MKAFFILRHCLVAFFLAGGCLADAAPLINEIFYRPGTGYPENRALEFIEIYNPEAVSVDLSGWAITSGAAYTFPSGTVIAAGGYRVVVADVSAFQSAYPAVTAPLGPWAAGAALADRGEKITLSKPGVTAGSFATVDSVSYADEGDWAVRKVVAVWDSTNTPGDAPPNLDTDPGLEWITAADPDLSVRVFGRVIDNGR
ncbi:MAG: lamin tail domain-containing protein, partial [Verrucomicrobiota bacterium]